LVLGSATPSLESYHRARGGDWTLLRLPERVVPHEGCALPRVTVVDMRRELRTGNRSIFSRALKQQVSRAVDAREQVILFLNRRGTSSFIQCRGCGFVMRCKRCEIALTYHAARNALVCHHCSFKAPVPARCPECSGVKIKFLGLGTEKLEQEAGELFPQARTLRWDRDTTAQKDAHETILRRFRDHEADILIGTQMVAKGLDLPRVTLVGVISADTSLNLPDFRAGERAFQLLSQVAGRAGRGERGGQVIIQTYSPDHYAVESAAAHDYAAFYDRESEFRRRLGYPPFTDLALLVYTHPSAERCRQEAARMKDLLLEETARRGLTVGVSGPVPAFYSRLRGRARWQILLRGADLSSFLKPVWFPPGWTVDVDPVSLV
ncbi:MAG: primosomal protein N', partial [Chloroflexi bacterium]|nr:primosomal protein N' [Chloroflexota bacterium]